jgi:hypothetical protein
MEASTSNGGEEPRRRARNSGISGPTNLTVVQYNVLSDALSGADAGFTSLPPDEMDFSARGRAQHSFPFPLNSSLPRPFPLNLS